MAMSIGEYMRVDNPQGHPDLLDEPDHCTVCGWDWERGRLCYCELPAPICWSCGSNQRVTPMLPGVACPTCCPALFVEVPS
jgi:hypothetical protein